MSDADGITLSIAETPRPRSPVQLARPQLILALESNRPGALSARYDLEHVRGITLGRGAARTVTRQRASGPDKGGVELEIKVPDRWMSSHHARLESSFGRWLLTDTQSKNGVFVNGAAVQRTTLKDRDLIELGHTLFLFREALPAASGQPEDLDLERASTATPGMMTLLPALAETLAQLRHVAGSTIPVLLQGESGTGKEVVARAVHEASGRPGPMIAVNCGAIPANLVESELFGHKKGAFSGAIDDRPGLVRSAHGGTLFLDEIGDLPAPSQAALLRVLQEREVLPVGGIRPVPVDLRVVAATHQDLLALIDAGEFRRDLFARLSGFEMHLPPLCERMEDLGMLIGLLFRKITGDADHPGLDTAAVRAMFAYPWPLNIRELEQTLATAVVLSAGATIGLEHLPEPVRTGQVRRPRVSSEAGTDDLSAEDSELRRKLVALLGKHRGNVSAVARDMGKDRKQIHRWLERFQLRRHDFRDS